MFPMLTFIVRYLVKGRAKPEKLKALLNSIDNGTLGNGSIAGDEYLYNMTEARVNGDGARHGSRPVFAIHRWPKNAPIGRNISNW